MRKKQGTARKLFLLVLLSLSSSGCFSPKTRVRIPTLLKSENASQERLLAEISRFARIYSMRAQMDLKFEDNSFAEFGIGEKYRRANGDVVVQRPGKILLKVEAPVIRRAIAQMTSEGEKFRVAILEDGGAGEYRKFVVGSNGADYSSLQKQVNPVENNDPKAPKQNVNAFAMLRPQHFTEAILIRPVDTVSNIYVRSELFQEEYETNGKDQQPSRSVLRGYYILDEIRRDSDGTMRIMRRFWFDRSGAVRLARQQIFDAQGGIDSDVTYSDEGDLSDKAEYKKLPLRIEVTRPKEKYKMSLSFQNPSGVSIGKEYPEAAFVLENSWDLPVLDLDQKLRDAKNSPPQPETDKAVPLAR
jgi:hypothetical protein